MFHRIIKYAIPILLLLLASLDAAQAANERAISDGTQRQNAITSLGCDDATCTQTRIPHLNASGAVMVEASAITIATASITFTNEYINDFEPQNITVPATSAYDCSPAATMSFFVIANETAHSMRYVLETPAASAVRGIYLAPYGKDVISGISSKYCSIYNPGAAASASINWGRYTP